MSTRACIGVKLQNLTDAMPVYIQRNINDDFQFAAGLSQLWEVLYSKVDGNRLLIAEFNVFGSPLGMQCVEFLKKLYQTELLNMLEIRKTIAERDDDIRLYLLWFYVHKDDDVGT
nr:hypothetical protein [Tanacetum cinerariifolium]